MERISVFTSAVSHDFFIDQRKIGTGTGIEAGTGIGTGTGTIPSFPEKNAATPSVALAIPVQTASRIRQCAIPGTLFPSLKLVLLKSAPVGRNKTFFQFFSSNCFKI